MTDRPSRTIDLRLDTADDEELAELERALLKARATELGEARRRNVRLSAGYGDATTREVLDDEGRRAEMRHDMLSRLLDALRAATAGPKKSVDPGRGSPPRVRPRGGGSRPCTGRTSRARDP